MPDETANLFEIMATTRSMRRLKPDPVPAELIVNGGGKLGQMPAPELANSAPFSDGGGCVSALARALPT